MMNILLRVGIGAAALWLFVRWFEWKSVYVPSRAVDETPREAGLDYEDVEFVAEDGVRLHGWWIPHPHARGTILYCHGNGGNIGGRVALCRDLRTLGVSVFIFDYRGYGLSRGWSTEEGTYRDARAAYEVVRARYGDQEQPPILVYGSSLGAAIAAQLAMDKPIVGAVFEAGASSITEVGERLFPHLPVRWMSRFRYQADRRVAQLSVPKLFAHSREDQLIPYELGRKLFDAAADPKIFFELLGPHGESGWERAPAYWPTLARFVDQVLPAVPPDATQ